MNPDDAVLAHKILQPQQSVGMHYGTFPLSDEGIDAPSQDLRQALDKHGVPHKEFLALDFGQTIRV
jgi:L-ascorbate metabolism protein UlaG (beta-lactamase superfamily)